MKPYLWWWALLIAVLILASRFGANGTTRLLLEIGALVLFGVVCFVIAFLRLDGVDQFERDWGPGKRDVNVTSDGEPFCEMGTRWWTVSDTA